MAYTRTSADDYNLVANITGDQGWSWDSLAPYIAKVSFSPLFHESFSSSDRMRNLLNQLIITTQPESTILPFIQLKESLESA
jgi:hypothetical protein